MPHLAGAPAVLLACPDDEADARKRLGAAGVRRLAQRAEVGPGAKPRDEPERTLRAVVLDDERSIRALVRHLLRQAGGVGVVGEAASVRDVEDVWSLPGTSRILR